MDLRSISMGCMDNNSMMNMEVLADLITVLRRTLLLVPLPVGRVGAREVERVRVRRAPVEARLRRGIRVTVLMLVRRGIRPVLVRVEGAKEGISSRVSREVSRAEVSRVVREDFMVRGGLATEGIVVGFIMGGRGSIGSKRAYVRTLIGK
jgi:hypothetical protein